MSKPKSAVSFIRKQTKIKGSSDHTGWGFFILNSDVYYTYDELLKIALDLLPKWRERGLVKSFEEFPAEEHRGRRFELEFVPEEFGKYRTWSVMERDFCLKEIGVVSMNISG